MKKLETQIIIDGMGQGILIFDSDGRLVMDNIAVRTILGSDLNLIRTDGWKAAAVLFNTRLLNPDDNLEEVRKTALEAARPVRFHIFRSGQYLPCWAAALQGEGGMVYTMLTLELPDWTAMTQLIDRFRQEIMDAVEATQGHVDLITQTMKKEDASISKRIGGFTRLISVHMHRTKRFMEMFERLEHIRTGSIHEMVRERRRKIVLDNYIEDFVEELDEIMLVDPETEAHDHRSRITTTIAEDLFVQSIPQYLTRILHDVLRNAIMYSLRGTPIKITARASGSQNIQIDISDEGYGIREKERERVFFPFQRSRQPQIMGEFGYGLSLYLCKCEMEAMNGRMWFESEEGVGTTFSLMLPQWRSSDNPDES